jgi:hypothetical protein
MFHLSWIYVIQITPYHTHTTPISHLHNTHITSTSPTSLLHHITSTSHPHPHPHLHIYIIKITCRSNLSYFHQPHTTSTSHLHHTNITPTSHPYHIKITSTSLPYHPYITSTPPPHPPPHWHHYAQSHLMQNLITSKELFCSPVHREHHMTHTGCKHGLPNAPSKALQRSFNQQQNVQTLPQHEHYLRYSPHRYSWYP